MSIDIGPGSWCLYLLECRGGAMYAGITNRLAERFAAHQAGKGAKFTRANPPLRILGAKPFPDRSEASKAEYAIKRLPRSRKLAFLATCPSTDQAVE
ncbi:GIY-YIG nuclease family protein [Variovorax sp. LjRoot175]|uniref:GIY-YIG nuclease family protein n=1 Tax=Variovorax sp. LjRoot175 TaxID=3342276 RepID=UPI003ED14573